MKTSKLSPWNVASSSISVVALLLSPALSEHAHAFGGFWSSQNASVKQAAEQIIFVDNPDSTVTAIVHLQYAGPPQQFAWVIPIPGTPTVGVSSNTVFQRLDAATTPQYWVEVAVEEMCQQNSPDAAVDAGPDADAAPSDHDTPAAPVAVIDHGSIGPYDYLNITVDPTTGDPAKAATDWLTSNGYDLTGLDSKVLSPYLSDGLNLLAFKLTSDTETGAIRPVILRYESKLPMIPIRPTAVAAQDDLGIQVWVIGPSQAVPDNYASLVINDALFDWLTGPTYFSGTLPAGGVGPFGPAVDKPRNYDAIVTAAANEAGGQGFVTELGAPASQYRDKVWSPLDAETFTTLSSQTYADGIDAIVTANNEYGSWDGWTDAIEGATTLPAGVTLEAFARDPDQFHSVANVDTAKFFQLLDEKVVKPVSDTAAMFLNAPYLTRLYTTMSADEMTVDPAFNYNADLALVSHIHIATQFVQCGPTPDAPWRIELPQGGVVAGETDSDWPVAEGSLPANLKVVKLSTHGSGSVVTDNSKEIGMKLFKAAGTTGTGTTLQSPQNGVMIGGSQTVRPRDPTGPTLSRPKPSSSDSCSVSHAGNRTGSARASWLLLAGVCLALRRRRRQLLAAGTPRAPARWRGAASVVKRSAVCAWSCLVLFGCSGDDSAPAQSDAGPPLEPGVLTRAQLRDPETCKGCHPNHYREWSSSMHAYSAQDPVFVAMNKRGQRETNGELGDFCIQCHAPMAVVDERSKDGLNLDQLPDKERGVSCYYCHNVVGIEGDHNAKLRLANDTTMRGPIRDPLQPRAHRAEFSEMFEDTSPKSSALCGGCHDIVTPTGVHLERTLQEYRSGIFSKSATGEPPAFDSCVGCHMPGREAYAAAVSGAGPRTVHEHLWPGIDVPLTDFPHRDAMRSAVEDCQLGAASLSYFTLEVTPPDLFTFQLETNAGHNQPSGSAQDRRMWLEFLAYDESGALLAQVSSGNIADGEIEDRPHDDPKRDPHLLMFRDRIYDAKGKPVHMFWEAEKSEAHPDGYESNVLPVATTTYIEGRHSILKQYRASTPDGKLPARVTARVRIRPIGVDVLQDLVASGDLDRSIVAQMPTLDFGATITWTPESGVMNTVYAETKSDCSTYRCLLDPGSEHCSERPQGSEDVER